MKTLVIIALIVLISDVAAYGTPPNYQIGLTYPSGYVVYDDHDNQVIKLFSGVFFNEYLYLIYQARLVEPWFVFWRNVRGRATIPLARPN